MIDNLREYIAQLSEDMGLDISYEYTYLCSGACSDFYRSATERHSLYCSGYKMVNRCTLVQIMKVTKDDFVKVVINE